MASARSWSSMDCWARTNSPRGCAGRLVVPITSISPSHRRSLDHALETLETIKTEAEEIYARYRPALEALAARLNAELEPLDRRVEATQPSCVGQTAGASWRSPAARD